jgi:hypothetical protein
MNMAIRTPYNAIRDRMHAFMMHVTMRDTLLNWFGSLKARLLALAPTVEIRPALGLQPMVAEDQPDRQALIAELNSLELRAREEAVVYQSKLDFLGKELVAIERHASTIRNQLDREHGLRTASAFATSTKINKIRIQLADLCPAQVDELLSRINAAIESLLASRDEVDSVKARLARLRRIRDEVATLKAAPISTADLLTTLRRLEHDATACVSKPLSPTRRGLTVAH